VNGEHKQPRAPNGRFTLLVGQSVRDAVRIDYEAEVLTLAEMSRKYGISCTTIDNWKRIGRWTPRQPRAVDTATLAGRMLEVLSAQIGELEGTMTTGVNEVAMLSKLARTLDKVLLLKERPVPTKPRSSKRVEELRNKIAERIIELNKA
jgi:hypothetical protein